MSFVLPLYSIDKDALLTAGGKGANLGALARAGFPVPPGFVVTTAAYQAFLVANQLTEDILRMVSAAAPDDPNALEEVSAQIRARFAAGQMPADIAEQICQAYADLCPPGPAAVAVRSSATAEDLPDMSFAGQQDTYLNVVGEQAVLSAVARCWGSLWTARAIGYRARSAIDHSQVALAVVVQQMIESETSGVLFTANPLTGTRSEVAIDAAFGLGEALVSGMVEPDHYVVDTDHRKIKEKRLGAKQVSIHGSSAGGTFTKAQPAVGMQALTDGQIFALADIGQRIARVFGSPQDIEWAYAAGKLYILQSRPITTLFPIPSRLEDSPELKALFSFASVQGILDPLTPMGQEMIALFASAIANRLGQTTTPETQSVIYHAGERLFINFTGAFRHLPWRKIITHFMGSIDPLVQQAFFSLQHDPRLAVKPAHMRPRTRLIVAARMGRILSTVFYNLASPVWGRARLNQSIEATVKGLEQALNASGSMSERLECFDQMIAAIPDTLFHLLPAVISGQVAFQPLLRFAQGLTGSQELAVELTRGIPHNVTTEMDLALWQASRAIYADPQSAQRFASLDAAQLARQYLESNLPAAAQQAIDAFLQQYGMRGLGEIDFGRPRWREDPTQLMQVLGSYLRITDERASPQAVFARGAVRAAQARQELIAACRRSRFGWLKARYVAFASTRVRELVGLRETPKFTVIRMLGLVRQHLLADGAALVNQGILAQPDDVFYLRLPELKQLAAGQPRDWQDLVASRRQAYQREKQRRQIPRLLLSDGTAYYDSYSVHAASSGNRITGSPVSPGVVEGVAHVLLDPRGAQLSPGEILVCPATDPGWTPLFLAAGGLVMELGGMMTHGSVVAREYGIPAVVGVPHATSRIKTGQRLRVDGSRGEIEVLSE